MELASPQIFNNPAALVEGWYWALRSSQLKAGKVKAFELLGKDLVLWRDLAGEVHAHDAFCPHMGAHLAEGKVEEGGLRCFFHHWKFDGSGRCVDIPCAGNPEKAKPLRRWPVEERYGLIWIYAGETPRAPVPFVPELEGQKVASLLGGRFTKDCHPNVMMINAIDEQHFRSVHPMAGGLAADLHFDVKTPSNFNIQFHNRNKVPMGNPLTRFFSRFYRGPLTYVMSYWFASTGTVSLGPDFLHFHIIFTLRPTRDGKSLGQTILLTKHRDGLFGQALNFLLLHVTNIVGKYFAHGDTKIFRTIRFRLASPIAADRPIIEFIRHTENQKLSPWSIFSLNDVAAEGAK